jgi:Protein of unknown function (DUF3048) N-terminal domain/Protein of unknown function (DUF3048) C-terminal domain/Bacterial Ig-like domain
VSLSPSLFGRIRSRPRLLAGIGAALAVVLIAGIWLTAAGVLFPRPTTASLGLRDGQKEVGLDQPLVLTFTRPVQSTAVESALTVSPAVEGALTASPDGRHFTWKAAGPWTDLTTYTVTLKPLRDAAGRTVPGARWRFTTTIVPRVTSLATDKGGSAADGAAIPLGTTLSLVFNTTMNESSVSVLVNAQPATLNWSADGQSAALSTKGIPAGGLDLALGPGGKDRIGHLLQADWKVHLDLVYSFSLHTVPLKVPALVQIPNDNYGARDQSGLQAADMAFEYQTEGGITRITALFTNAPDVIGPIRSGRLISFKLTRHYRGINYFSGLSSGSFAVLQSDPVPTLFDTQGYYYRSPDRVAPNNLYLHGSGVQSYSDGSGVAPYNLTNGTLAPFAGTDAPSVSVPEHNSTYAYDAATATYLKTEDGHQMADASIGQPLHIQLLVVMHTHEFVTNIVEDVGGGHGRDFDMESGGIAEFYYKGKLATGRWTSPDRNSPFVLKLDSGQTVTLPKLLTWVDVVSN